MRPSELLAPLCLFSALTFTGCSAVQQQGATTVHINLQGRAMGGEQPIVDSTIQLYAVGVGTDGGASTALINQATHPVTTSDGTGVANSNANAGNANNTLSAGSFTITGDYTCPSASTLVYLAAIGGNPGVGTNTAQEQIVALGQCGNLTSSTYVTVNEITTVATVRALSGYITAYNAVGSTVAHESALATAFSNVNEYVNTQYGQAPGPSLSSGYDASANDLRALANSVQNCVDSNGSTANGSTCGTLFGYARGTAGSVPANTVTALVDIFNDPTNNVTNIFNAQGSTPAFAPVFSSAPTDWSLPIRALPAAPTFSPAGGSYAAAQTVTISDTDGTATIYYTTNGATPTTSSTGYSGSISVATSETVNAIAVDANGRLTSAVGSATYSGTLTPITQTGTLSAVSAASGSDVAQTITATSNANGAVVTFGTTGSIGGSFSPTTCTIAAGTCSVNYIPSGTLAVGIYTNDLTASFGPYNAYTTAGAASTLTIVNPDFTFNLLDSFSGGGGSVPGNAPQLVNLIQGNDGNFYGAAFGGASSSDYGIVFKVNPSGANYTGVYNFATPSKGQNPYAGVVQGTDGNFYGMTSGGGANGDGTIFQLTPAGALTVLHSFAGSDGSNPTGTLVQGADGKFYGMASNGGAHNSGVIFSITTGGTYNLVYNGFIGDAYPEGGLVQGSDGKFYGMTASSGSNDFGMIFSVTTGGTFTTLWNFTGFNDGASPYGSLVQGANGYFYGMTSGGGVNTYGVIFSINSTGSVFNELYAFSDDSSGSNADGASPFGSLVLGSDGNFYGMAQFGGASNSGTVFSVNPAGSSFNTLYAFSDGSTGANSDGAYPLGSLVQGSDGNFYGLTSTGGPGYGTIFKVVASPALAPQVALTVPSSVTHSTSFNFGYSVSNAYTTSGVTATTNTTLQNCQYFAYNSGGTQVATGALTGSTTKQTTSLTAPATAGTYTYALTCGGTESGFATLTVL